MYFGRTSASIAAVFAALIAAPSKANAPYVHRGYQTCISDLASEFSTGKLRNARDYYVVRDGEFTKYFVNSTVWLAGDGDRVRLRTRCDTTDSGRKLVTRETSRGKWVRENEGRISIYDIGNR